MSDASAPQAGLPDADCVVRDDLRFKSKLGVGERAFPTVVIARRTNQSIGVLSAATAGATVASSSTVAGAFFAGGGWLSAIGFGAATVTPVGWVVAAAAVCGGSVYGVMRLVDAYRDSRIESIPKFINTNIDVLGVAVLDMLGGVALRIAAADHQICDAERDFIADCFVEEWGIDRNYARAALGRLEEGLASATLTECLDTLKSFVAKHPDCDAATFERCLMNHLSELTLADGRFCSDERAALAVVGEHLRKRH